MEILFPAFLVAWLGSPIALGVWFARRWRRMRRRNESGQCALCETPWPSVPDSERFLVQGRLVCGPCAHRARRRMRWHLAFLTAAGALTVTLILRSPGPMTMLAVPVVSVLGGSIGALQLMKRANRRTQEQLEAGRLALP